jgi:hypothetical protein
MFSLFRKSRVLFATQLAELAKLGIVPSADVTDEDWTSFYPIAEYEAAPYQKTIETLGCEVQRDPFTPMCPRLWMCDYERIEDHGSYRDVIDRLQLMSDGRLPISGITDYVDIEESKAWVEFDLQGQRVHWDAKIDNDWLDPSIVVKFDELLRQKTDLVVYSNHTDFGQSALFTCMTRDEFSLFNRLSRVKFDETRKQA